MKLLFLIILAVGIASIIYAYYIFFNITLAIWIPEKSNEKWVSFVGNPACQLFYPFLKWVAPIWVLLVPVGLLIHIITYVV